MQKATYRPVWLSNPTAGQNNVDEQITSIIAETLNGVPEKSFPIPEWGRRFKEGMVFLYPWLLSQNLPLGRLRALEVGCGTGPKAIGLSQVFASYTGIDLDGDSIIKADSIAKKLSLRNLDFLVGNASAIDRTLGAGNKFDVIILHAVVEHLTIEERLHLLRYLWDQLDTDGVLYVGELPNRLCPVDQHSSYLAYYNGLPDELAVMYADRSKRAGYAERVSTPGSYTPLYRSGRPASYHEFELSIAPCADLKSLIHGDAWDNLILNLHPMQRYERDLLAQFGYLKNRNTCQVTQIPAGFSRYWLYFILRKGKSPGMPYPAFHSLEMPEGNPLAQDQFSNPIQKIENCSAVAVPKNSRLLTLGISRDPLSKGVLTIENDRHEVLFQGGVAELSSALGDHWNPHVYLSVPVTASQELFLRTGTSPAINVTSLFFR